MKTLNQLFELRSRALQECSENNPRLTTCLKSLLTSLILLFTLSIGNVWANYAPTDDEVIILKDVYSSSATTTGYSTHSAIAWAGTASTNSKKAGDPNNGGAATSSNVPCYSVKGNNAAKSITISFTGCSKIIIYHESHSSRYVELRSGNKTGTLLGKGSVSTYYTEVSLTGSTEYSVFLHGTTGTDDQDFNVYAIKLIKASGSGGGGGDDPSGPVDPTATFSNGKYIIGGEDLDLSSLFTSNSDGAVTYSITDAGTTDAALRADGKSFYAATAGSATVKASQAATSAYNAIDKTATITVAELVPSSSINIEQLILDYSTKYNIGAALDDAHIGYVDKDALDSLKNQSGRNEPFLGLKFKKSTSKVTIVVPSGQYLKVKFGSIDGAAGLKVSVNGSAAAAPSLTDGVYTLAASTGVQEVVFTQSAAKTVVYKQIKINEDISAVQLPFKITYAIGDHGTCAKTVDIWKGEALTLPSVTAESGWDFVGWFDGGNQVSSPYTPTADVTLTAQYVAQASGTDLDALTYQIGAGSPVDVGYSAGTFEYDIELDYAHSYDPITVNVTPVTGASVKSGAKLTVSSLPGSATFTVTDGTNNQAYKVNFSMKPKDGLCIIKATHTGAKTADVEGVIGGEYDKNTQGSGKLGSNDHYFGIKLAEGTFKAGDQVEIYASTTSTKVQIFSDKGTTMIDDGVFDGNYYKYTLTAATEWIYLYRTSTAGSAMNPTLGYIAVYRPMAPVLKNVNVAGVEGTPNSANNIVLEVPFTTTQAQLEAITYNWVSNNDTWTANHTPSAGAWTFGVKNTITLTDKDGDQSVYYVTVNKAVASDDATLSELSYDNNPIDLVEGVFDYTIDLEYGTTAVPALTAVKNHVGASEPVIVDAPEFSNRRAVSTVTVTAEDGQAVKVYTVTFNVARYPSVVIWDGSTMNEVAESPHSSGLAWEVGSGFGSVKSFSASCGAKTYTKTLESGGSASATRNIAVTVPAGYVVQLYIVVGTHKDGEERGMFVGSTATKTLDESAALTLYSSSRTNLTSGTSSWLGEGTYYINPMASVDFYEIRAILAPGYGRTEMLGKGVLGTVCVDHNVAFEDISGASFYELVGNEPVYGKIVFDEIISGELTAGKPYLFQADGDKLLLLFGETVVSEPNNSGALKGTFVDLPIYPADAANVYFFREHALWSAAKTGVLIGANRAYVQMDEVRPISSPNPAPGCRRIVLGVNGTNEAQGIDDVQSGQGQNTKVLIDGQLFILRGEKMFDATGRLVK